MTDQRSKSTKHQRLSFNETCNVCVYVWKGEGVCVYLQSTMHTLYTCSHITRTRGTFHPVEHLKREMSAVSRFPGRRLALGEDHNGLQGLRVDPRVMVVQEQKEQ
jgi:hypothetical protein